MPEANAENLHNLFAKAQMRAGKKAGVAAMAAQQHTVTGEIMINGAGEARTPCPFPVSFIHMPGFQYGVRLPPGQPLIEGDMPYANVLVLDWTTTAPDVPSTQEDRANAALRKPPSKLYTGCTIGTVTHGPPGTKLIINWSVSGVGLVNMRD